MTDNETEIKHLREELMRAKDALDLAREDMLHLASKYNNTKISIRDEGFNVLPSGFIVKALSSEELEEQDGDRRQDIEREDNN